MVQVIGIGQTLHAARLSRGKSIEEASRETHIRAEYLQALERERFDDLLGDVYVRAFLRSYSTYLGLDGSSLVEVYNGRFGVPRPTLAEPAPRPARVPEEHLGHVAELLRHPPSWSFLIVVAVLLLAIFAAVGLLSHSSSAPPSDTIAPSSPIPPTPPTVTVGLQATSEVVAVVKVDNAASIRFLLHRGEFRSFQGTTRIAVDLAHGGTAIVTVNGQRLGEPGSRGSAYRASFGPQDFRGQASPSAP